MRIYSRHQQTGDNQAAHIDVHDRQRAIVQRGSVREDRDATVSRDEGVRREFNAAKLINPSNLDAPPPRAGFVQRWVAEPRDGNGKEWLKKMREGWRPRDPSTISNAQREIFPTCKLVDGVEALRVSGLILCELPRQAAMQKHEAVNRLIASQTSAVPESLEQLQSRRDRADGRFGPVQQEDAETSYRGRQVQTMVD